MLGICLLSFLPLLIVATYWLRLDSILFIISLLFLLMLAAQVLKFNHPDSPRATIRRDYLDSLTGLINRRGVIRTLNAVLKDDHDTEYEAAVLHIDIDRFRQVNDRFGMECGDTILHEIAARLRGCVRNSDDVPA